MNVNPRDLAFTQTWSATLEHVNKLSFLTIHLGVSKSEVIRQAIDLLYERCMGSIPTRDVEELVETVEQ